jgi:hypothetical protein
MKIFVLVLIWIAVALVVGLFVGAVFNLGRGTK